jgi:hypothetical protein
MLLLTSTFHSLKYRQSNSFKTKSSSKINKEVSKQKMRDKYAKQVMERHHMRKELVQNSISKKQDDRSSSRNRDPRQLYSQKLDDIDGVMKNEMGLDHQFSTQTRY